MLPTLRTARMTLDTLAEPDTDALWAMLTDPEVRRYLCDNVILPREFAVEIISTNPCRAADGLGLRAIRMEHGFAGIAGLKPVSGVMAGFIPDFRDDVELTIALLPQCWGRGLAAEAITPILAEHFAARPGQRIAAVTDEPNLRSRRLLEGLGFSYFGTFEGVVYSSRAYTLAPP